MTNSKRKGRITVPQIRARKGAEPIACLTAYTAPVAQHLDPYLDLLLVGDSLAMVVYGMDSNGGPASGGSASVREAVRKGPSTQDYLDAIGETRTTVSEEVHQDFLEDIGALGRV